MNSNYINQVAAKLRAIEQEDAFHEDTVLSLLVLIRQHLETNRLKQKYKITNFYCNWCLHSSLNREPIKEILQEISKVVEDKEEMLLNDRINEIISIQRLRQELVEIVASDGISSSLFSTYRGWQAFLRVMLKSLLNKPIQRTDKPTTGKFVQQLILEIPDISTVDGDYLDQNAISESIVFWKVLILPIGYYVTGPLVMVEHPDSFR
jgi:hypothetical protein